MNNLKEMNEQFKDCPVHRNEYEIGGKKVIVVSHFTGDKHLEDVLLSEAYRRATEDFFGTSNAAKKG